MNNTLKPMSYTEQVQGSLFSWKTSGHLYHAMNECQVANLHGHASFAITCTQWISTFDV